MEHIIEYNEPLFEDIKHIDDNGNEYWYARELQYSLDYTNWKNFEKVINKAKEICELSDFIVDEHFVDIAKVKSDSNAKRKIVDYKLSRHACYLIAQNGDPRKEGVAKAQSYIAMRTMQYQQTKNEKIPYPKNLTELYSLNQPAKKAGVKNLDKFNDCGCKGLYNGETVNDIAKRKHLRYHEDILDNMNSEELAANLFMITQTEAKLKRDNIKTESNANKTHYEVGQEVRNTIKRLGGIMPEELPTYKKSSDFNLKYIR